MRSGSSSKKNQEFFFEKKKCFWQKTKASYLMTETLLVQKVAYTHAVVFRKRMVSLSFISFEKYELQMRKKTDILSSLFCPKKTKYGKNLTSFLGQNVAYGTLVQLTKPWTLYLVSILRYRGSNMENSHKKRFFQKLF